MADKKRSSYSYWVVSNRLMAGDYPGVQKPGNPLRWLVSICYSILASVRTPSKGWYGSSARFKELIQSGINSFVDLTEETELPEYASTLNNIGRLNGLDIRYARWPIKDRTVPPHQYMSGILDYIDQELAAGRNVYVHCLRGLGRTGITVGCYMVRHGQTGPESVDELHHLRRYTLSSWLPSPQTSQQREMIINWSE